MKSHFVLLISIFVAIVSGCIKSNYRTILTVDNKSSFDVSWSLTGFDVINALSFDEEKATSKEQLVELIERAGENNTPEFTFYIIETKPRYYEDGTPMPEEWGYDYEYHKVGSKAASDCNIFYVGTGGEGLLRDYTTMYCFKLAIDDAFLSRLAAENGIDFAVYNSLKKK